MARLINAFILVPLGIHREIGDCPNEVICLLVQTILSTLIVLVTGEFLPKTLFKLKPNRMMNVFAVPAYIFYIILWPISKFTSSISKLLLRIVGQKVKKAEEEYNSAYNEAYRKYMKKLGYDTNEHNILMKIRNVLIVVIAVIIVCLIAWIIPPVRKILINIYEDNIIIKYFVDIIGALLKSIASIFE